MSEWTHGFVIFLNLITLGFVIGEAIRGPSNILAPSGHPPRFSYTWRPLIGGSHAIRGRLKSAAPRPRHSRPIPVPPQNGAPPPSITHTPTSCVGAWWTEPSHHLAGSHLFFFQPGAGNSVFFPKKKIKNRTSKKKEKERKFQTIFPQNLSGGLSYPP